MTRELREPALDTTELPDDQCPAKEMGFEAWLSHIGEDQPYRSVEENLKARQQFVLMSRAIGQVLGDCQRKALQHRAPKWLDNLVSVLHERRSAVLSFDYDNLIEYAVDGHCLRSHTNGISA